jgi:hypothetical protein
MPFFQQNFNKLQYSSKNVDAGFDTGVDDVFQSVSA